MLRVVAHGSAAAARQYYAEGLKREDYYSEKQEVVGKWHGQAAKMLGLFGDVSPESFARMVENQHPETGDKLTPRMRSDRRVGYDINFHAPKSLSVLEALTGDERIVAAFREAVSETMAGLEERVETRVRKGGGKGNRQTGNLAWAEFVHFTARPVGGIPDPHLHVHCFAFNMTFDRVENRWKAAEMGAVKAEAPYAESAFHASLAGKISALGYAVERTKNGWEVAGIPRSVIQKFSRRTTAIEDAARELGIVDPKEKDKLGALTREGKRKGLSKTDLLSIWKARLTPEELAAISAILEKKGQSVEVTRVSAAEAMDYAVEKCFERESVVVQNRLVREALKYGLGGLAPEDLWKELSKREMVVGKVGAEILCTTVDVLAEEISLIGFVRGGRGKCAAMGKGQLIFRDERLSNEQRRAVSSILKSTSQVIAIRGGAGVGKTTLMTEAAAQIESRGHRIFAFAPSAVASRETLRASGFDNANTVAHLLQNQSLQSEVRGNTIWIDEAGLLGVRELWEVMKIAGKDTRVVLTGDSFQHAPVARGDAFRLIQHYAGLPVIEVTEIRRQEREIYKKAVAALSRGDMLTAFRRLEEIGAFVEVADDRDRYQQLAKDYVVLSRGDSLPLVISPTHAEGREVTDAIRNARKESGQLKDEREFLSYRDLRWTEAEKKQPENYAEGLVVQFHQNAKGILRGAMFRVTGVNDGTVSMMDGKGKEVLLPLKSAERFQVFETEAIRIARGDQVRITRNGESANGKRLNNGNIFTVEKFTKKGNLVLSNGAELVADHGHFTHGYCATSHSSQSRSVRDVLVAQGSRSFAASSKEQLYVSVSRGKESIRIYTDDLPGLKAAVGISSTRLSGVELAGLKAKEIAAMSDALNSKQWRDTIKSRAAAGSANQFVKNLVRERRQDGGKKSESQNWRQYVEMRRGLVSADGKSRSKGHPTAPAKRNGTDLAQKRRSFLRPTEHAASVKEKMKQAVQPEKPAQPKAKAEVRQSKVSRAVQSLKAAAQQFKRVVNKPAQKKPDGEVKTAKAKLPQSTLKQAAKRSIKAKAAEAAKRHSQAQKVTKAKVQAAPVRGPRR